MNSGKGIKPMISDFASALLNKFHQNSIEYAILRNHSNFPNKPQDSCYYDLDIIANKRNLKKIDELLLEEVSSTNSHCFIKKIFKEYVCTYRIIIVDSKLNNCFDAIQIDIHINGQGWWGFYYLNEKDILSEKKQNDDGFFVLSNFYSHLFNWLDKGLWGNYVKEKYTVGILDSYNQETKKWHEFFERWFDVKHRETLQECFINGDLEKSLPLMPTLRKKLINNSLKHGVIQTSINFVSFIIHELKQFIVTPGMHLVLNGFSHEEIELFQKNLQRAVIGDLSKVVIVQTERKKISILREVIPVVRRNSFFLVCHQNKSTNFQLKNKKHFETTTLLSQSTLIQLFKAYSKTRYFGSAVLYINKIQNN